LDASAIGLLTCGLGTKGKPLYPLGCAHSLPLSSQICHRPVEPCRSSGSRRLASDAPGPICQCRTWLCRLARKGFCTQQASWRFSRRVKNRERMSSNTATHRHTVPLLALPPPSRLKIKAENADHNEQRGSTVCRTILLNALFLDVVGSLYDVDSLFGQSRGEKLLL